MTNAAKLASLGSPMVADTNGNVGIGTTPTQLLETRKDQAAYTWTKTGNQSTSSSAYAGVSVAAYGNTWGMAIGSTAANGNTLNFVLDAGGTNVSKMSLDSSGRLITPSQPSFFAYKNTNTDGVTSQNPVQFDVATINVGSCYNTSTYTFTAPVAGKYWFGTVLSWYVNGNARQIDYSFLKNGNNVQSSDTFITGTQGNNTHTQGILQGVFDMSAGDTMKVSWSSSTASINFYSSGFRITFSGYLIG